MLNLEGRSSALSLTAILLLSAALVRCSADPSSPDVDAEAPPPPSDVSTHRDAPLPPKADAPCACTLPPDGASTVTTSLACFCASFRCPDYFAALTTCSPYLYERLVTYESCNLETINVRGSYDPGITWVYDRTTHELVGAKMGTEGTKYPCADGGVWSFQAGMTVPQDCAWKAQDLCLDGG